MKKLFGILLVAGLMIACSKPAGTKSTETSRTDSVLLEAAGDTCPLTHGSHIDSVVTEEFSRLLRYNYSWFPETGKGHCRKAIPNLGPEGETTVYVCVGEEMFEETDLFFLMTNAAWDNPDYFEYSDCLALGPEMLGDSNEEGTFVYRMTYDIHDSILTIKVQDTKIDDSTGVDSLVGSMTISHTYSVRYWTFRYLSSDTVLYGDTKFLSSLFEPRKAHLGYKIEDWKTVYDDDVLFNDPRWAYAEEKLWDREVCAFLCGLMNIADGGLAESLDYILFESLHNNSETNRCMAEYLASLPALEQEWLLQALLHAMGMSIYDYYPDPEDPQLIYPDFESFMQAFPVFDSPYNSKAKYLYEHDWQPPIGGDEGFLSPLFEEK